MPSRIGSKSNNKVGHDGPEHGRNRRQWDAQQYCRQAVADHRVEEITPLLVEHADVAQLHSHADIKYKFMRSYAFLSLIQLHSDGCKMAKAEMRILDVQLYKRNYSDNPA